MTWTVDQFFDDCPVKTEPVVEQVDSFLKRHSSEGALTRPLVVVTSGGTTVPLERRCVRFIDNFSGGTRGALSTENFLEAGYAVIFLHRKHSVQPFVKGLPSGQIIDVYTQLLHTDSDGLHMDETAASIVQEAVELAEAVAQKGTLLRVTFETLFEYLAFLRVIAVKLDRFGAKAAFYMAAAVSDFFIPWSEMVEHKMQSAEVGDELHLTLQKTPKMLGCLRREWAPNAFIASFKLETNDDILVSKAEKAISSYGVHCVVANILHTRKEHVLVVKPKPEDHDGDLNTGGAGFDIVDIRRDPKQRFIETQLVAEITHLHQAYMKQSA